MAPKGCMCIVKRTGTNTDSRGTPHLKKAEVNLRFSTVTDCVGWTKYYSNPGERCALNPRSRWKPLASNHTVNASNAANKSRRESNETAPWSDYSRDRSPLQLKLSQWYTIDWLERLEKIISLRLTHDRAARQYFSSIFEREMRDKTLVCSFFKSL